MEPTNEPKQAGIYWATDIYGLRTIVKVSYGDPAPMVWQVSRFGKYEYWPISNYRDYVPCIDPLAEKAT